MITVPERLNALRQKMKAEHIDAFIVYSADPHMSEYLPDQWKERVWLSGFTGSYGYMVITQDKAALWTDGRYFVQAAAQLQGTGITMMKDRVIDTVSYVDWIIAETKEGDQIAVNALATAHAEWVNIAKTFQEKGRKLIDKALLDEVWIDRDRNPKNPIFVHPIERAGKTAQQKIVEIREEMKAMGATTHILTSLDDVAWTTNLRGSDIECNPVFLGYFLLSEDTAKLYVHAEQLTDDSRKSLAESQISILDYDTFYKDLQNLKGEHILVSSNANQAVYNVVSENNKLVIAPPPGQLMKAIKNETELKGVDTVMERDGVAMVNFLYWLRHHVGKEKMTEFSIGKKLYEFRAKGQNFVGESFATIVGYKGNDALPHYRAIEGKSNEVFAEGSVLIDSGGQYLEGTTDITRTIPLGKMTDEFRQDYTTVMKGYLALQAAKFPRGTRGSQLDILARLPLWEEGKDFNHGTGHGVGSFMNVHEGPQAIRKEINPTALELGMVLSNEPGYYLEGHYGIRHENLMKVVHFKNTEWNDFYQFEVVTLCPYFKEALVIERLTPNEKALFNAYHEKVKERLLPYLDGKVKEWFLELVKPI